MMGREEMIVLQIGYGHVIYTGGAKGTDELAESWGRHFGMQVDVLVPPHHPGAQHIAPSTVEVLVLANPQIHLAVQKLGKQVPRHHYTLQLLQRNYQVAKKAHIIFAFGTLNEDTKRVEGGTGWTVQMALNQGKQVYLFNIPSQTWFRSENYYESQPVWSIYGKQVHSMPHPTTTSSKQCRGRFPRAGYQDPRRNRSALSTYILFTGEQRRTPGSRKRI